MLLAPGVCPKKILQVMKNIMIAHFRDIQQLQQYTI